MFAISPTDNNWFKFLKENDFNSFVNFWTPTPWNIKQLKYGQRWYFLLKNPIRKIAGFGEFHEYKNLTPMQAWKEYGHKNGTDNIQDFTNKVQTYIDRNSNVHGRKPIDINDYKIGCIILINCQFFEPEEYKTLSDHNIDFGKQIVKYKYFESYDPFKANESINFGLLNDSREIYKKDINQRKGQSKFKGLMLKNYKNQCCISGENCPELLEAAHIQKYINNSSNHPQNGILLRVDLHRLFDNDLLYIDETYTIHVSSTITSHFYTQFHGSQISLPDEPFNHPSKECLMSRLENFRK